MSIRPFVARSVERARSSASHAGRSAASGEPSAPSGRPTTLRAPAGFARIRASASVRRGCGVLVSAAAVAATLLTATGAQASSGSCPDLYVVAIPGTWETSRADPREGLLADVTSGLPGDVRTDYVSYPATAMPWEADVYGQSKRQAVDTARAMLRAMAQRCAATRFALLGYSQGADAAGDLAAEIGTGTGVVPPGRVDAVGLVADPRRGPTDLLIGPPVPGAGAEGPRIGGFGLLTPRVRTFCAVGDLYCSTPTDDFATRIAGFVTHLSAPDPGRVGTYQQEAQSIVGDVMAAGGVPVLQSQFTETANDARLQQLRQFLESSVHQGYPSYVVDNSGQTATSWLHHWLSEIAAE
ncbi:cutinase family protein [Nocardia alni]|uniref:cutinase family protein n=1 Tax=Nocardia alni TaxID=2815723 RepID=UPI003F682932